MDECVDDNRQVDQTFRQSVLVVSVPRFSFATRSLIYYKAWKKVVSSFEAAESKARIRRTGQITRSGKPNGNGETKAEACGEGENGPSLDAFKLGLVVGNISLDIYGTITHKLNRRLTSGEAANYRVDLFKFELEILTGDTSTRWGFDEQVKNHIKQSWRWLLQGAIQEHDTRYLVASRGCL